MKRHWLRTAMVLAVAALMMQAAPRRASAGALESDATPGDAPVIGPSSIKRAISGAGDNRIDFGHGSRDARRVPGIVSEGAASMRAPARADAAAVAESRDVEGMVRLGLDYWRGANGPKNPAEARRLFEAAAERGDVRGKVAAAWMLAEGLGTQRDAQRGRDQLESLARQGVGRAAYLRALLDESPANGRERNDRLLLRLQEASALGDPLAQNHLGMEFERLNQIATARLWYSEAAKGGSKAALDNLERMESKVAKLRTKTPVRVLAQEAERGDRIASFELAQRYHRGDGVSVNYAEAVRWYQASAGREYGPARQMLALIYSDPATAQRGFDSLWMRRLAQMTLAPDGSGPRLDNVAEGLPVRDADPLAGLESVHR